MAPSKVQSTSNSTGSSGSSTTIAKAYASNVTAGNFLFAVAGGAANTTCTFSSSGDTWATIATFWDGNIGQLVSIGYAANVTGGAKTVTATFGTSTIFKSIIIEEWSGVATSSPLDTNTTGLHVPATTTPSDNAMTTTTDGDLILGGIVSDGAVISAGTGYTLDIYESGNHYGAEFQVQGTHGSTTVVWTLGSSAQSAVVSAAFKPAGGTNFSQTVTDAAGLVDNRTQVETAAQTVTDSTGETDNRVQAAAFVQAATDTAGSTDVLAQAAAAVQAFVDGAGSTDVLGQVAAAVQAITDGAGLTDSTVTGAPPSWQASGTYMETTTAAPSFAVPSGVAAGDIIVIPIYTDASIASDGGASITAMASGFAHAPGSPVKTGSGTPPSHSLSVVWKRATGADTGTYDFTLSASVFTAGAAQRYSGAVASGVPFDTASGGDTPTAIDDTSGTVTPAVNITTAGPNRMLIFSGSDWAGGAWTPPTGFTERMDSGSEVNTLDDLPQLSAGNTGSVSATCAGSSRRRAWIGALKPSGAATDYVYTITDSTGSTDVVAQASAAAQTITDQGGQTDNQTQASAAAQTVTDAAGLTDTTQQSASGQFAQTITDSAGSTDTLAQTTAAVRSQTDVSGLTDNQTAARTLPQSFTDAAGLTDQDQTQSTAYADTETDTTGLTDNQSQQSSGSGSQTFADNAGLTDTLVQQSITNWAQTITDPAGSTDVLARELDRPLTDDAGVTDQVGQVANGARTAVDSAGLADQLTQSGSNFYAYTITDSAGLADVFVQPERRDIDLINLTVEPRRFTVTVEPARLTGLTVEA